MHKSPPFSDLCCGQLRAFKAGDYRDCENSRDLESAQCNPTAKARVRNTKTAQTALPTRAEEPPIISAVMPAAK